MEATQLAVDLPRCKSTIDAKISSFRTTVATGGPLARAAAMLEDFGREISKLVAEGMNALSMTQSPEQEKEPVPVEVRQAPVGPFERLSNVISDLLHPLAMQIYRAFILIKPSNFGGYEHRARYFFVRPKTLRSSLLTASSVFFRPALKFLPALLM
jgi:hypothetical protein